MINHKCVNCGKIYESASEEILKGCLCGGKLFYFVKASGNTKSSKKDSKMVSQEFEEDPEFLYECDDENNEIMIFDIESISVKGNGKYDINLDGLMNKSGFIYKYDDGKYGIDLDNSLNSGIKNSLKRSKRKSIKL
ncbi:MAG TPA: Zn-ribbon containing protein [Alphaproteobacteria bacterium]|nr:Zn-ribbon containing protein [Alphaproteobacteria bacterium]